MEKIKYIKPETRICKIELQNMLALSTTDKPADLSDPLVKEDIFKDIWGNEF